MGKNTLRHKVQMPAPTGDDSGGHHRLPVLAASVAAPAVESLGFPGQGRGHITVAGMAQRDAEPGIGRPERGGAR
jgi:hypothetical protein